MTATTARTHRRAESEADFMTWVAEALDRFGWLWYHTHDSRRSQAGFPDICAVHPDAGRILFAELKSAKGRVSKAQSAWLRALNCAGVDAFVWWPEDRPTIQQSLDTRNLQEVKA